MKRSVIIFIFVSFAFESFSQETKLFLICGQYYDTQRDLSQIYVTSNITGKDVEVKTRFFNSILYQLVSDSLKTIDTLAYYDEKNSKKNEEFHSVRLYHDRGIVIVYCIKNIFKSSKDTIVLKQIYFNNPYVIHKFNFIDEPFYKYWTVSKNGSVSIINEKIEKDGSVFLQRNILSKNEAITQPDSLSFYISDGHNGLGIDDIFGGWGAKTEKLEIVKTGKNTDSIFQINHTVGTYTLPSIQKLTILDSLINNITPSNFYVRISISSDFLLVLPQKAEKIGNDWYRTYYFFNKQKKAWFIKTLPGSYPSYRIFDKWLGGTKTYMANKGYDERIGAGIDIPGKKFRNQNYSNYSSPADFRFRTLKIFPTGYLFIYYIDSDKYIEWEALEDGELQGDSEVLLVINNIVYYRINDKIFKAPIINGEKLGEPVLLVKDDRVPAVHWAFMSGS